jgi:hypothetical protein
MAAYLARGACFFHQLVEPVQIAKYDVEERGVTNRLLFPCQLEQGIPKLWVRDFDEGVHLARTARGCTLSSQFNDLLVLGRDGSVWFELPNRPMSEQDSQDWFRLYHSPTAGQFFASVVLIRFQSTYTTLTR